MKNVRTLSALAALTLLACEPPPVFPGADKRQNSSSGRIEGNVVITTAARGKVVLFLYDAARPPPPVGTGRPLTFTVLSRENVFGADEGSAGPFTAPFAFSLVAPGNYLVRGFIDANDDFIPWYGATADATAGDVGGAAVDPVTRAPRVIVVGTDEAGSPVPALDVAVSFTDAAKVPLDRPIFSVLGGADSVTVSGTTPTVIELQATPIVDGVMNQPSPGFLLRFVDDNADGMPDDANGDGVPDLWPRVVVRKLSEQSVLLDENDLDKNGVLDATGVSYVHADSSTDNVPDLVVLAAGFDPTEYAAQLVDGTGRVKQTPTPVPKLKLVLRPRALDASNPAAIQPLQLVPAGRWAITVIQQTGQTWRVPNELGPPIAGATGLPEVTSQAFLVTTP